MIDYLRFATLTENTAEINKFLDFTLENGENFPVELNENTYINVYDYKDDFFGLRLITDHKKDPISFYPLFDTSTSTDGVLKGVSEFENNVESIRTFNLHKSFINTFALDHVFHKQLFPQLLGKPVKLSLAGLVHSQDRQLDPPKIKQKDGSLITTKGSSIFYNIEGKPLFDYIYQFKVEKVSSIYWNDFIEIIQIKTTLFRYDNIIIDFFLYVSERVLQNNYYPKKGDDVMGIMQLSSNLFK